MEPGFLPFLPMIIISIPYAVFAGALAQRLNGNTVLWVILALIPFVGIFFFWYLLYRIVTGILDRIDAVGSRLAAS